MFDHDRFGNDYMGSAVVPIFDFNVDEPVTKTYPLLIYLYFYMMLKNSILDVGVYTATSFLTCLSLYFETTVAVYLFIYFVVDSKRKSDVSTFLNKVVQCYNHTLLVGSPYMMMAVKQASHFHKSLEQ